MIAKVLQSVCWRSRFQVGMGLFIETEIAKMSVEEQNVIREKLAGVGIILSEAESTSEIDCGIGKMSFITQGVL